jgi:hypothetical protein
LLRCEQAFVVDQDISVVEQSLRLFSTQSDNEKIRGVVRWLSCTVVVWWTTCI